MAGKSKVRTAKASRVPDNETKAQKFSRLASFRLTRAVKVIGQIGNLASSQYEFSQDQLDTIKEHLTRAVNTTLARFIPKKKGADQIVV